MCWWVNVLLIDEIIAAQQTSSNNSFQRWHWKEYLRRKFFFSKNTGHKSAILLNINATLKGIFQVIRQKLK